MLDLRATKWFRVAANVRLDVFLEAYDLFNTVNYENPERLDHVEQFYRLHARDARQIQWGARFQFLTIMNLDTPTANLTPPAATAVRR